MAKRSIDEILDDKTKIKLCKPGKSAFISLDELSNYYFSRSIVARKIKYLESISGNKVALFSRLINSYYFLIFTLLTANYRQPGEKVSLFPPSSKGGPLIAGEKSSFSPPISCVLLKYVLFPPMLSKTLKTTHYETNHALMFE